jgi:PadR family transcriptional regulator, regulatory protein PadR
MYSAAMIEKELVAASTEPLILSLLAKGESYGYELIQEIKRLSGEEIRWTDGMLYPVLHRMEDSGWITGRWVEMENGRKRKYYSIKQDGHQALTRIFHSLVGRSCRFALIFGRRRPRNAVHLLCCSVCSAALPTMWNRPSLHCEKSGLKKKREPWTVISTVLGWLWKGQHV